MHIEIFGLDKYVVATLSHEVNLPLLKLTQLKPEQLFFSVHETLIFHDGVDQNAWHTIIKITLEPSLAPLQEKIAKLLIQALKEHTIHIHLEFYLQPTTFTQHVYQDQYPLFVTETNQVNLEQERVEDDHDSPQEIYHGNAFAGKEDKLEKLHQPDPHSTSKKKKVS